jgi:hypothetical protein
MRADVEGVVTRSVLIWSGRSVGSALAAGVSPGA